MPLSDKEYTAKLISSRLGVKLKFQTLFPGMAGCYLPANDAILLDYAAIRANKISFWGVLYHELAHSTGNKKRIGRPSIMAAQKWNPKKSRKHYKTVWNREIADEERIAILVERKLGRKGKSSRRRWHDQVKGKQSLWEIKREVKKVLDLFQEKGIIV